MKIDALAFSFAGDKYIGRSYSEMDCQAFVERCMRDCGLNKDLAGSNAWYREVMKHGWVGSPEDCKKKFGQIPKGALLFILKKDGKEPSKYKGDGIGNASHIGIYIARHDGAINSSKSRGGVCYSKFSGKSINGGWNRVGLYDQFDYGLDDDQDEDGKDEKPMQGTVTAQTGATVNLRKSPDGDLIERIPIGTKVTIIDYGPEWCKVTTGKLTGYMMTEFIELDGEIVPGEDEPIAKDPDQTEDEEDFIPSDGRDEYEPGDMVQISLPYEACVNAYPLLRALCEQIEDKVGRG